jgi:hypothetical protein
MKPQSEHGTLVKNGIWESLIQASFDQMGANII